MKKKTKTKAVIFDKTDTVGTITIHRPEVNNAINEQVAEELVEICHQVSLDDTIRVTVITGAGQKYFSIGTDPNKPIKNNLESISIATHIASLRCPTIAAINGDALGQGLELALACDIRIAAGKARFAVTHIAQGMIPWDGATQRLARLVGITPAAGMILTGEKVSASEALRIGLISKVVPSAALMLTTKGMAESMARQSPLAMSFAKEAINNGVEMTLEQGLRLEADLYFLLHTTDDRTEGIKAFLEKRPPTFKGR